jgi:hypothetical protein
MTEVESQSDSLEGIGARLLSGVMVTLLGCALAGVIAWQIIAQLTGWLPDLKAMTADLPPADFNTMPLPERRAVIQDSVFGAIMIFVTLGFVQRGIRYIRKTLPLLHAHRRK